MVGYESELPDGFCQLAAWLPRPRADELLVKLRASVDWDQPTVTVFGRQHLVPRLQKWFGDHVYRYSGIDNPPTPFPVELNELRLAVEATTNKSFNSALVNRYRNGDDTVGWHADNEPELGPDPTIAMVSLGATRDFVLRRAADKNKWTVPCSHGDLTIMHGNIQREYQHAVPRRANVNYDRISITFRWLDPHD